jgi:hypothetical protein
MKQYKFESWFKGDVTLLYSEVSYKEENKPVIVTWENFAKSEVIKIKKKQSDIFHENVSLHLEKFKTVFNKRYNKSLMPEKFLEKEIEECYKILFEYTPDTDKIITNHWKILFYYNDLLEIQEYADRTILRGIDVCLDFIHSPNNKYQRKDKIPSQVYAQLLFEFQQWLETNFITEKEKERNEIMQNRIWFKVGLLFANGEMDALLINHKQGTNSNYTAIAKELGNKSFRPFISESYSDINDSDKNIFSNEKKIIFIEEYCKRHNIPVVDSFKNRRILVGTKQYKK